MPSNGQAVFATPTSHAPDSPPDRLAPTANQIGVTRAVAAVLLGIGFVIAVGDDAPTAASVLPAAAAAILTAYPVIDVIASILGAPSAGDGRRALYFNAAVSAVATAAIGVAAFGSDAGATLVAFGSWAIVSGIIQFVLALRDRRAKGGHLAMLISGGLSALVGLSFVAASRESDVNLGTLAAYMIVGAILFIISARRRAV
ncbi:MAG: hypothetical protein AAGA65_15340 [Actinomycetota bacterium]